MLYLVDGYNVLYALGWLKKTGDAQAAERARRSLLQRIVSALGAEAERVLVLFDAARAPGDLPREERFGPLRVLFSPRHQDADSVIEELLRGLAASRAVVVSADRRLRQAARRRRCPHWSPEQFMAWLEKRRRVRLARESSSGEDKERLAAQAKEDWLREFRHLEHDPALGHPDPLATLDVNDLLKEAEHESPPLPNEPQP